MLLRKHTYIAGLILAGLLVGCGGGSNSSSTTTNNDTSPSTPPTTTGSKMFTAHVMPVLDAKCKSCHGSNGDFMITSPDATYANISDLKNTVKDAGQYLIDKGSNTVGHGGGTVIATHSSEYATIKSWVDAGADFN